MTNTRSLNYMKYAINKLYINDTFLQNYLKHKNMICKCNITHWEWKKVGVLPKIQKINLLEVDI